MGGIAINLQGVLAVAGVLCGALLGCDKPAPRHEIRVMAAASLRDAFEAIEHAFEPEHPNTDVVISFAGSQVLATQLLEGAAADVFASADEVAQAIAFQKTRYARFKNTRFASKVRCQTQHHRRSRWTQTCERNSICSRTRNRSDTSTA